mgnify:FL=1
MWGNLSKSDSGAYRQTSLVDGVTRLRTYRKVHGFPVVAVIGTALSDTLAASTDIKAFRYAVATLITVIGIALVFLARRAIVSTRLETELEERKRAEVLLLNAKEDAEKANAAKSQFLAGMSHDLRTPLNAIIGFSDIMRQESFGPLGGPEYKEYANDIHHSGGLLVSLINDVLDLSKIEAGKYELEEEHLDISSLVQTSIRQLAIMAEASKQVITSDIKPHGLGLWGEKRAMIQLLNNLLSNAIKFTPDGGHVTISTKVNEGNSLHLSVIDTGIGMSAEGITRAMEPFEHAKGSVSRRQIGSGLDL